jgi:hypothetical protein
MTTTVKHTIVAATKEQIMAAHATGIAKLMRAAATAAAGAARHAGKGELNIAISYLLEIEGTLRTVTTLKDAVLALHRNEA